MPELAPGDTFAGYRIEDVAGRGGMGIVYRATDLALDRRVALKVIAPALAGDAEFRRRFNTESKTAASLDHPNVIPIYHAGEHEGMLFLVMRYVDGSDLRAVARRDRLTPTRSAGIVAQIGSALDAAHDAGLVHRDVKPANVLITPADHVYLTDFGLTKRAVPDDDATQTGTVMGTFNYVAPEQIRGVEVGPAADVYALGCVLFQLLTGRVPFPVETEEGKLWAHLAEPPPAPSAHGVPPAFDEVVSRAMSKTPAERFPSAGDLGGAAMAATIPQDASRAAARPLSGIATELLNPFSVLLLAALLAAGAVIGNLAVVAPIAGLAYAVSVALAWNDRREPAPADPPLSPVAELVDEVLEREAQIRETIDEAGAPLEDISTELDRFERVVQRTAARAELLHQDLDEGPPETISARLRMEEHMRQFYARMEGMLAELEELRQQLAPGVPADGAALAAEMRDFRRGIADIGDDLAAARVEHGGHPPEGA